MKTPDNPIIGQFYDRQQIHEMFGGNTQSALPFAGGKAVAGCYDPKMNPKAPEEILVGVGRFKQHYSKHAAENNLILPIFLKRANREYEFVGYYRAETYSTDRKEIKEKIEESYRDEVDVAAVLYFKKVEKS
jgi:hypothetical protein